MRKMYCKIFGHDYKVSRHVTSHVKEYICSRCQKELTIDGNGSLTELTPKLKEINDILEQFHNKRKRKLRL